MNILLAGPGTGKTAKIKDIISNHGDSSKFLVLSFTKATVEDLHKKLSVIGVPDKNCMTLHKFAIKNNPEVKKHILLNEEERILKRISESIYVSINFTDFCDFLFCTTFDQMIIRFISYVKSNPFYLKSILSSYDALIVDEYQDLNPPEQDLIDILIKHFKSVYILGDDDQCIYDFKDSSSDKMISFHKDPINKRINHENVCYRCPDLVVEHARNLITMNKNRISKEWKKPGKAGIIEYKQLDSLDDVANSIIEKIILLKDSDILILSPVRYAIMPLIDKLNNLSIAFSSYYKDKKQAELLRKSWEARSIYGENKYLNMVLVGYKSVKNKMKFYAILRKHFSSGQDYKELFDYLCRYLPGQIKNNPYKDIDGFLSQSYYDDFFELYKVSSGSEIEDKMENIFKNRVKHNDNRINIMSIHKSKGLDADYVFIVGLVEGIIPNKKNGNDSIESQRRLLYVGITRTKKQLYLFGNNYLNSECAHKIDKSEYKYDISKKSYRVKPSSFISELKL